MNVNLYCLKNKLVRDYNNLVELLDNRLIDENTVKVQKDQLKILLDRLRNDVIFISLCEGKNEEIFPLTGIDIKTFNVGEK